MMDATADQWRIQDAYSVINIWTRDKDYEKTVRHPLITGIAKTL